MTARPRKVAGAAQRYGYGHRKKREQYAREIERGGLVNCWRCHLPIVRTGDLHMGHDDDNPTIHRGPEHSWCNLGAAARKRNRLAREKAGPVRASQDWW